MFEQPGQQAITENRAGAGENVGIASAAKSPPDCYTIVIATSSTAVSPSPYLNPGYDALRDLVPVARLTSIPNILLVYPTVPAKTLQEFIRFSRAHSGKLNYVSGGAGTTNHLANELLKHLAKIDMVHLPYKGVTQAMSSMITGEVDEVIMPISTALAQLRAGKFGRLPCSRNSVSPRFPTCRPE